MPRSRSRSRSRDRRHGGSTRHRRSRSRSKERRLKDRSRDSERHRHRSSEQDGHSRGHAAGAHSKERQRRRSRSRSREHTQRSRRRSRSASPPQAAPALDEQAVKRQRLEAWRAKQQQQQQPQAPPTAATSSNPATTADAAQPKVWMPWEDGAADAAPAAGHLQAAARGAVEQPRQAAASTAWMPWEDPSLAMPQQPQPAPTPAASAADVPPAEQAGPKTWDAMPAGVAAKKAKAAAEDLQEMLAEAAGIEEEDPLEAFMAAEILPEVKAREAEERRLKEAERLKLAQDIAEGRAKLPTVEDVSDEEETPDLELQIPTSKVKLLIGPGGTKIGEIQKKSKARLQVKKEEDELNIAFGAGPAGLAQAKAKAGAAARNSAAAATDVAGDDSDGNGEANGDNAGDGAPKRRMTTIMIFGEAKAIEIAMRMIDEAVSNKEQKAKQRQKEYERKRDMKKRERQLYHMRHAHDYEALGLPMGASKADVKKAHRKLAVQWHPDKHAINKEEATAKFQEIQKAYDSLMSTNEDDRIEQLEK